MDYIGLSDAWSANIGVDMSKLFVKKGGGMENSCIIYYSEICHMSSKWTIKGNGGMLVCYRGVKHHGYWMHGQYIYIYMWRQEKIDYEKKVGQLHIF